MSRSFKYDLKYGKKFEMILYDKLKSLGVDVIDVSKDPKYQKYDIDMVLSINNKKLTMEIKADKRISKTRNIFVEDVMERKNGDKDGWLHYCRCDILCYVDDYNDIAYLVNWVKLRKFVLNEDESKKYYRRFYDKVDNCYAGGYLIPLKFLRENDYIFRCIILEKEKENG